MVALCALTYLRIYVITTGSRNPPPPLLMNPQVHYRVRNTLPLAAILSYTN
jgi:hypothetical protein